MLTVVFVCLVHGALWVLATIFGWVAAIMQWFAAVPFARLWLLVQ